MKMDERRSQTRPFHLLRTGRDPHDAPASAYQTGFVSISQTIASTAKNAGKPQANQIR